MCVVCVVSDPCALAGSLSFRALRSQCVKKKVQVGFRAPSRALKGHPCALCRFTVIPCTAVAGLEVQSPGGAGKLSKVRICRSLLPLKWVSFDTCLVCTGWTYPEVQGRAGVDVAVLVGETLHDLAPIFPMAVHRVMTPRFFLIFF